MALPTNIVPGRPSAMPTRFGSTMCRYWGSTQWRGADREPFDARLPRQPGSGRPTGVSGDRTGAPSGAEGLGPCDRAGRQGGQPVLRIATARESLEPLDRALPYTDRSCSGLLQADRQEGPTPYWFDGRIGHADIAVAAALRFIDEAHPGLVSLTGFPALEAHATRMEALPVFQAISKPFIAPA